MNEAFQKMRAAVAAYRQMNDPVWMELGEIHGALRSGVDDRNVRTDLYECGLLESRLVDGGIIKFCPPVSMQHFFARDWDELLERSWFFYQAPADFYVAVSDYWHVEGKSCPEAAHYQDVLSLVVLLREVSDHHEAQGSTLRLIFIQKEKLEIVVRYDASRLRPLDSLPRLQEALHTAPHEEQKRTILKTILVDRLKHVAEGDRFCTLLDSFAELVKRFDDNYQVYISEFSFDKVREEVAERGMEYTVKLNGVLTEIQNKFLSVPVALLLAAGQMQDQGEMTIKNFSILLGEIVFSGLIALLVENQRHTLRAVWEEIAGRRRRLQEKHAALYQQIDATFTGLERRYRWLGRILSALNLTNLIGLAFTFAVFFSFSPELGRYWLPILSMAH